MKVMSQRKRRSRVIWTSTELCSNNFNVLNKLNIGIKVNKVN